MKPKLPFAKPRRGSRKRAKLRMARAETGVKQRVRARCEERDGYCRLSKLERGFGAGSGMAAAVRAVFGACEGPSEWAHLEDKKRARTRGQAPEVRHTDAGTCMMCRRHHRAYDDGKFGIRYRTPRGAEGPVDFVFPHGGPTVAEPDDPLQ